MHLKSIAAVFAVVAVATVNAAPEGDTATPTAFNVEPSSSVHDAVEKAKRWIGSWTEREHDIEDSHPFSDEAGNHSHDPSWGRRGVEHENPFDDGADHEHDPSRGKRGEYDEEEDTYKHAPRWAKRDGGPVEIPPEKWAQMCEFLKERKATGTIVPGETVL